MKYQTILPMPPERHIHIIQSLQEGTVDSKRGNKYGVNKIGN